MNSQKSKAVCISISSFIVALAFGLVIPLVISSRITKPILLIVIVTRYSAVGIIAHSGALNDELTDIAKRKDKLGDIVQEFE